MTLTSASWWTNAATAEETPLSMQKLWSGDRQSEMAGNSAEKIQLGAYDDDTI